MGRHHAELPALPARETRGRMTSCSYSKTRTATVKPTSRRSSPTACICRWGSKFAAEGVYLSQRNQPGACSRTSGRGRQGGSSARSSSAASTITTRTTRSAPTAPIPSGALMMCEGVFLRTNVETRPTAPVRATNGGFYRFSPQRRHLERHAQLSIPNPWGIAFDDWGQHFFLHTSGADRPSGCCPGPSSRATAWRHPAVGNLIEPAHRVRPTSGIEFLQQPSLPRRGAGRHAAQQHDRLPGHQAAPRSTEDGTGYATKWRQDLTKSSTATTGPVDLEVAPDGSLFIVDWHNPLIGHMQHNARDPHRDHGHGRIYRITYPSRPLVEPAEDSRAHPSSSLLGELEAARVPLALPHSA